MNKSMLLFALNVIRAECNSHSYCSDCPFYVRSDSDGKYCGIQKTTPIEWNLLDEEPCTDQLIF